MEEIIYVKLLDEGVLCYRPVNALKLKNKSYKIVDKPTDDETWEFQPDEIVRCSTKKLSDGFQKIAVERI